MSDEEIMKKVGIKKKKEKLSLEQHKVALTGSKNNFCN
jgi:hypothetical protein